MVDPGGHPRVKGSAMAKRVRKTDSVHPRVGEQKYERGSRPCIKCGHTFNSKCPGNRICGKCKRILGDSRLPLSYYSELNDAEEG